jgi:hypothetical protein
LFTACTGLTSWLEVTDASDATGRASSAQLFSALWDALLPHLRRDEDEAMPLVSVALSDAECGTRSTRSISSNLPSHRGRGSELADDLRRLGELAANRSLDAGPAGISAPT